MYYFYILQSLADNRFYYGSTSDLNRRLKEHQAGKVTSTKSRTPLKLVYYEAYRKMTIARKRERQLKHSGNARKVLFARLNSNE